MNEVSRILSRISDGDPKHADRLLPLVYDELRRLAAAKLARVVEQVSEDARKREGCTCPPDRTGRQRASVSAGKEPPASTNRMAH